MTELYLQKDGTTEWKRVYFDDTDSSFKMTRENPLFSQAESYTLDITLPMDIIENRQFMENLHRMDRSKRPPLMKCWLMVDKRTELYGSAKVTKVTESLVKVQLLGGRSEINFLCTENQEYIDQIPIGTRAALTWGYTDISTGLPYSHSVIYNETKDLTVDIIMGACHPQLVGVMRLVLRHYGFEMQTGFLDEEPWSRLYIASAMHTLEIAHKLPHWTMREFMTEFCNFFCVTPLIDQESRTVEFIPNHDFLSQENHITVLTPVEEYQVDINEEEETASLMGSTLGFALSSSQAHDTDCLQDNVRKSLPVVEVQSYQMMNSVWGKMAPDERRKKLFVSPERRMISWVHEYNEAEFENVENVDMFRPLDRGTEEVKELKIVPVAMARGKEYGRSVYHGIPTMANPAGDETPYYLMDEDNEEFIAPTAQEIITGEKDAGREEKEDIMQVMFDDGGNGDISPTVNVSVGFTDFSFRTNYHYRQRLWSLSLNNSYAECYLGQLHQNRYDFNLKAKYVFRFIGERMPDVRNIFIIRGKQYACEKMEASVNAEGFDRLMTGYFYEFL